MVNMTFILVVFVESVRAIVSVEIRNRRGNNNGKTRSSSRNSRRSGF
jgi:hypothetical protein